MKFVKFTYCLCAALLSLSCGMEAGRLEMNYNSADISTTEDEQVVLAGFAARKGLSDGIHLPLRTHCLVIRDSEGQKVCIISNDLMEISPSLTDTLREMISERSSLAKERILVHNIHSHSAPRSGGASIRSGGTNRAWKLRMTETLVDNAVRTITDEKGFEPFKLETGIARTDINANRCEKDGPVDSDVYVARFLRKGKPSVSIINIACHPVCMGSRSLALSSDYAGVCGKILSESWGGEVFQLTGASGNMDPAEGPKDLEYAENCGRALAESLVGMSFTPVKSRGMLRFLHKKVDLPYQCDSITPELVHSHANSLVKTASKVSATFADDVRSWEKEILERFKKGPVPNKLRYGLSVIDLDGVLFFFTDGEPFCEYQMEVRRHFPERRLFFAAYTNGQNSYLPSERAYRIRKGYEYETEQMHVYIKAPYPLSSEAPAIYSQAVNKTIQTVMDYETVPPPAEALRYGIIPAPESLTPLSGSFVFGRGTALEFDGCEEEFGEAAEVFALRVKNVTGFDLKKGSGRDGKIIIRKVEGLGTEEYGLSVSPKEIIIEASETPGVFYALQTVLQLLPSDIYSPKLVRGVKWELPCCKISDKPAFPYRGILLDCGRHFFSKEFVLKFIDQMAMRKFNVFHWHLTEDQGWRIEIKKYPRLMEVASKRPFTADYNNQNPDGKPHEGYYTQDDVREVVEYARLRQVTVIPEIELPGHSTAALAAYPQLSCDTTKTYSVSTDLGIKTDVYCPSDFTMGFLEDVFTEILPLFPSKLYHIGGDECPQTAWRESPYCHKIMKEKGLKDYDEIQSYFVGHISNFLKSHGKEVMGWDEVLDAKPFQEMIAQSYRGHAPAARGMRRGHRIVLSPDRWCYFCYYQEDPRNEPKNQRWLLTLKKTYNYFPVVDSLPQLSKKYIVGVEGCVWTEYIYEDEAAEYWTCPRSSALAEVGWTKRENKDWWSFRGRMEKEMNRLEKAEVNCSQSYWNVIFDYDSINLPRPMDASLMLAYPGAAIHYTLDGSEPTVDSPVFNRAFVPEAGTTVKARGFVHNGRAVGKTVELAF